MFRFLLARANFFSVGIASLLLLASFFLQHSLDTMNSTTLLSIGVSLIAFWVNLNTMRYSHLVHYNNYAVILALLFMWLGAESLLNITFSLSFLCISILIAILSNVEIEVKNLQVYYAILLFIANVLFYPTVVFTIVTLFVAFSYSKSQKGFWKYVVTYIMCFFLLMQLLYLTDRMSWVEDYFCNITFSAPIGNADMLYFLPLGIFVTIAILDHFANSIKQSLRKRNSYNLYVVLFFLQLIAILVFNSLFDEQLLFLYFPISVFLGRWVYFIKNPYLQNLIMWLTLFSIAIIKVFTINFF